MTIDYLVQGGLDASPMLVHGALIYSSDEMFVERAAAFLGEAVARGEPALAVTSDPHIELLREALGRVAKRVRFAERTGWYRTPSAALSSYREFLARKFHDGAPWVRILGEPPRGADRDEDVHTWLRYEAMLNLAFGAQPVSIMCPYDKRNAPAEVVSQVRATHPHTVEREGFVASPDYGDPLDLVPEP